MRIHEPRRRRFSVDSSYRPFPPAPTIKWEEHEDYFTRRDALPPAQRAQADNRFVSQNVGLYWTAVRFGLRALEGVEPNIDEIESLVNEAFARAIDGYDIDRMGDDGSHFVGYFRRIAQNTFIQERRRRERLMRDQRLTFNQEPFLINAIYSDGSDPLLDGFLREESAQTLLRHMQKVLDPREYTVLSLAYGFAPSCITGRGLNDVQIGRFLAPNRGKKPLTNSRVQQIRTRALRKLRDSYEKEGRASEFQEGFLRGRL